MKNYLLVLLVCVSMFVNAQTVKDDFNSNSLGWTETSSKDGEAVIKDGVMHLEGKKSGVSLFGTQSAPSFLETHCFTNLDINKNFEIKCSALVKKINEECSFGMILDYVDEGNFMVFVVFEKEARLLRYKEYRLVGMIRNNLKLMKQKKADINLSIKSTFQKLQFYVNGMLAIESRFLPLTSNGIGFYVLGSQVANFDNLEIIQ